ncbi:ExbD/TolR family protein [Aquimarina mytili]|uniref:Biopolymer transporter ExbD n=1 Tax=Aquimarina mytili TaxID=874423 RepID=A0A936ZWW5_9FLAO|nr:biopolymer transporter ExbD [Aquimarina mytili]MBL0683751.1 biopolymer transporter ExbD [Aquimarina mytili]
MNRRLAPSVNAGSMADIAFLLLIFFLVTTTIQSDSGINKKLPPPLNLERGTFIKKKNLFEVELNRYNQLMVEGELMELSDLKEKAIAFLDNGGGSGIDYCGYCKGDKDLTSSDNPDKAVISLKSSRKTNYATFIAVQNELIGAYTFLRNREAKRLFGKTYSDLEYDLKDVNYLGNQANLKKRIRKIRAMYPQKIVEAELLE